VIDAQVLVLAKEPRAGHSKTRLTPPLSPEQAAGIARASLGDTLDAVLSTPVSGRTLVLDGAAGPWLPDGFAVLPQPAGTLNTRLAAAFQQSWTRVQVPMLLIGMDTPQVTPALLSRCLHDLLSPGTDAVLGHAFDGGWWALGLRRPAAGLFDGVPMSTDQAGAVQRDRLDRLGLVTRELPVLRDIDVWDDLEQVASALPSASRVAHLLAPNDVKEPA
jgi:glycosyltransferase A (GT-A) superfamily protein (DUF2064 family)